MPGWLRQPWISLRLSEFCSGKLPMMAKRPGCFFTASIATAFALGSQPAGGWISAASTPPSSISFRSSSEVNVATLRCRPVVGTTVCDQICTCASTIFMGASRYFLVGWDHAGRGCDEASADALSLPHELGSALARQSEWTGGCRVEREAVPSGEMV